MILMFAETWNVAVERVCPGMYLAEGTVLAAIMALLATVDIVKGVDANGKEIPVDTKTTGGFIKYVYKKY